MNLRIRGDGVHVAGGASCWYVLGLDNEHLFYVIQLEVGLHL
jgi:hypothetical protein